MTQGQLRQPRGLVKVNGRAMPSWVSWSWDGNPLYQADTFSVFLSLSGMSGRDAAWWAAQNDLEVELFAGFPADASSYDESDLESLFIGVADDLAIDWNTQALTLTGRDLTAGFLDNKTSEKFPNKTSSQIAETLAGRRGLTPVVTATKTKVGAFYKTDHVRLEDDRTEWDLLTWLAREEGFVVFVQGRELHFGPAPTKATYQVSYVAGDTARTPSGNFVRLTTSHGLTVAKDITVTVRSWNSKQKRAFTRKATRSKGAGAKAQNYVYTIPGLLPEQAQQRANQLLAELSKHEMKLRLDGPADNSLKKSDLIQVQGTGTAFDQTYFPDSVHREIDRDGGYVWSVSAKNHSPESQVNL